MEFHYVSVSAIRKERERTAREELILLHGRRLLLRDGYQNLNLDELARAIEYSKGTIYLHFATKEDLTLGIATRALRERANLFQRAALFKGSTRERIRAIGFSCCEFAVSHRDYFHVEMMLKSVSFWEKASTERRQAHGLEAGRCFHSISGIVEDAIRSGDLPSHVTRPAEVVFSLIATTMGSHIAAIQPELQLLCGIQDPITPVRRNQDIVCDGWGWKPLSGDWNYAATDARIRAEIFPDAQWLNNS